MFTKKNFQFNKIMEICIVQDSKSFELGLLTKRGEYGILIQNVGSNGLFQGFTYLQYDDISLIAFDTKYTNKVAKVMESMNYTEHTLTIENDDIETGLLEYSKTNMELIKVCLYSDDSDDTIGIVNVYDEDTVEVTQYDSYGNKDGIVIIPRENIRSIEIRTTQLRNIALLTK